jgi:DNA-binding Xre family transcriptional regulator
MANGFDMANGEAIAISHIKAICQYVAYQILDIYS